ncbi:MAG: DoxX family membrane protein [Gemmobacter sp.]
MAGRILLALLFAAGAAQKLADPGVVMGLLAGVGLPGWLVWPAALFNAGGALALLAGWRRRETGLLLAAYCGVTSLFHLIPDDPWQMSIFVKNWAIAGGLLLYAGSLRDLPRA